MPDGRLALVCAYRAVSENEAMYSSGATFHPVFSSPDWFLAGYDYQANDLRFLKTSRTILSGTAFHDGRSNMRSASEDIRVSLNEALKWQGAQPPSAKPHRIIVHTSFCGSTLLARALDIPRRTLSYREPQILIDLANLKAAGGALSLMAESWNSVLQFTFGQFQKSWGHSEIAILKPSNWVNTILPDLIQSGASVCAVLLRADIQTYLIANLRGGQDRVKFSLDLLNHLLRTYPHYRPEIDSIKNTALSPLQATLHMLAACYKIQDNLLSGIERQNRSTTARLSFRHLINRPHDAVVRAAKTFDLAISPETLNARVDNVLPRNSKTDQSEAFDRDKEMAFNTQIEADFMTDISQAVLWYKTAWGVKP